MAQHKDLGALPPRSRRDNPSSDTAGDDQEGQLQRSTRKSGRFGVPARERGLMAHRVQGAHPEHAVVSGLDERERLHEVPLCERARGRATVAHPRCEPGRLADCGEQRAAYVFGAPAVEHPAGVGAEVLDERLPRVAAPFAA
jgi:hypothetical protein